MEKKKNDEFLVVVKLTLWFIDFAYVIEFYGGLLLLFLIKLHEIF